MASFSNIDWSWVRWLVLIPAAVYIGLVILLYSSQRSLLYPGAHFHRDVTMQEPEYASQLAASGFAVWKSPGGMIHGLRKEVDGATCDWLIYYGNGDHALRASQWADWIGSQLPEGESANFYILEYPGYALRVGEPSEKAVIHAAKRAFGAIDSDLPRYLFGQSMGAAVATRLAGDFPEEVDGLFLTNPYDELRGAARSYLQEVVGPFYHFFPVRVLLEDRYRNVEHIQRFRGPVAIIAGEEDRLTPPRLAERLAGVAPGPVEFWVQPGVAHYVETEDAEEWQRLIRFLMKPDDRKDETPSGASPL